MASRSPTRVITQRLWSESISRSRRKTPFIFMASTIASTLGLSRPSEKFGTHSTRVVGMTEQNIRRSSTGATRRSKGEAGRGRNFGLVRSAPDPPVREQFHSQQTAKEAGHVARRIRVLL